MVLELLYVKFSVFIVLLFLNIITFRGKLELNILLPHLIVTGLFFISFFLGFLNQTPGNIKLGMLYLFWPTIYYVVFLRGLNIKRIQSTENVLLFSSAYIGLSGLWNILDSFYNLNLQLKLFKSEIIGLGIYDGYVEFTMFSLNSLPFLIPFNILGFFYNFSPSKRKIYLINSILLFFLAFLSLRKALWVIVILSILFVLYNLFFVKIRSRIRILIIILISSFFVGIISYEYNEESPIGQFKNGLNFSNNIESGNELRLEQISALTKGIMSKPFFGAGLGASAEIFGSVRNEDEPWSYEVYFLALAFQIGVLSFLLISLVTSYVHGRLLFINKTNLSTSIFFSSLMVLLVGFSNPVFMRFDGIWFFFITLQFLIFSKQNYDFK